MEERVLQALLDYQGSLAGKEKEEIVAVLEQMGNQDCRGKLEKRVLMAFQENQD